MIKSIFITLDFLHRFRNHSFPHNVVIYLFLIFALFPACAGKMSVEEARQVTVSMSDKSLVAPPRRIDDILAALDQSGYDESAIGKKLKAEIDKAPPQTEDAAMLAVFYYQRGDAYMQIGRFNQALNDLRLALDYSLRGGYSNHKLLKRLAYAEYVCGNFKHGIELMEQALRLKETPSVYKGLVKLYTRMGDVDSAEQVAKQGIGLCNRLRNKKGWGLWPTINAAELKALVLEAQGKFSEAEPYHRNALRNWSPSMQSQHPVSFITARVYLARNLKSQDRLVEAELEAREILKAIGALDRDSALFGTIMGDLGEIFLRQGRLQDAEKLMRAGLRKLQDAGVSSDSYLMAEGRTRLGEVLVAEQKFDEAMAQFDLAKSGMQQNQYLYKSKMARNPALVLSLLCTGRIEEATNLISAIYARNSKLFGEKHYLTGEALGFRGMVHVLQKNDKDALRDFSDALAILLTESGGDSFSYSRKLRRKIIAESYLGLLARVQGSQLEKIVGIDASSEAFKLADVLSRSTVRGAIGASTIRAAVTSPELAGLVRREQDAQKQLKILEKALTDNLAVPTEQQLSDLIEELKRKINILTRARMVLVEEIKRRFPKYSELTTPKSLTISQLQNHLRSSEAFISIYTAADQSYVWAIPYRGEAAFAMVPLGWNGLAQIVADLRESLDPKPVTLGDIPNFDTRLAYDLYRTLLETNAKVWSGAADLLIVAHGPLGQLPFPILPTAPVSLEEEEQELFGKYRAVPWLIRKASVTRLPSASAFVALRTLPEGDSSRKAFVGFGDPFFNPKQMAEAEKEKEETPIVVAGQGERIHVRGIRISDEGMLDNDEIISCTIRNLNRLPDTSDEIRQIAEALSANPDKDIFLGSQASEHQVKSMDLSDRRVIAFATHALLPGDLDGLDQPALALSPTSMSGKNEDGLLTMGEILKLNLNADWIVLSACNTGAAEGKGAEAVSGLGSAFFYAGTRAILVSMWPVETTSARELTTGLFQYQKEDNTLRRARALQKSMIALIDGPGLKDEVTGKIIASYAHPLFWAPFIIVGESVCNSN